MPDNENKSRSEDEWRDIVALADMLMAGVVVDEGEGRLTAEYLNDKPGKDWIPKERDARLAMAELLRSGLPLTQDFRDRLAALFDPKDATHDAINRKLIFENRPGGLKSHHATRKTAIAMYVYGCIRDGESENNAQHKAAEHFRMTYSAVREIWGHKAGKGLRGLHRILLPPLVEK
jgi:hypothetical protein